MRDNDESNLLQVTKLKCRLSPRAAKHEVADVADIYKNGAFIQVLLSELWDSGKKCPTLDKLSKAIVKFAQVQLRN